MTAAHPAATVILLHDSNQGLELLLLRRNQELVFCGGAWVFPGGRIDADDYRGNESGDLLVTARQAAVRETYEETGLTISADRLVLMSHWTTPEYSSRRFATYFFVTGVETTAVTVDGGEILEHRWLTPEQALEAHQRGEIYLPVPTLVSVDRLRGYQDTHSALNQIAEANPEVYS